MSRDEERYSNILQRASQVLASAQRVLVITGAGISADSGLPTYRGIGGLYEHDLTDDGVAIEEALSGAMLASRPELTWKYIAQIESACRGKGYNAGHEALAEIERRLPACCVLTQNIDGFHRAAGSRRVIEMHGNLQQLLCTECGSSRTVQDYRNMTIPPVCGRCAGIERPAVVLFGEMLPEAALADLYAFLDAGVDLVMSIGTTSVFPYIAGPVQQAAAAGIPTIEINPGESAVSEIVAMRLRVTAAEALPAMLACWDQARGSTN